MWSKAPYSRLGTPQGKPLAGQNPSVPIVCTDQYSRAIRAMSRLCRSRSRMTRGPWAVKAPSVGSATCRRRDARGSAAPGIRCSYDALLSLRRVFCEACRIAGASGSPARRVPTRAIIIATGAAYRRLPIENLARFEGARVSTAPPPSMPTLASYPKVSANTPMSRRRPTSIRACGSFCCPLTPFVPPRSRMPPRWPFSRAPTRRWPQLPAGVARARPRCGRRSARGRPARRRWRGSRS